MRTNARWCKMEHAELSSNLVFWGPQYPAMAFGKLAEAAHQHCSTAIHTSRLHRRSALIPCCQVDSTIRTLDPYHGDFLDLWHLEGLLPLTGLLPLASLVATFLMGTCHRVDTCCLVPNALSHMKKVNAFLRTVQNHSTIPQTSSRARPSPSPFKD